MPIYKRKKKDGTWEFSNVPFVDEPLPPKEEKKLKFQRLKELREQKRKAAMGGSPRERSRVVEIQRQIDAILGK